MLRKFTGEDVPTTMKKRQESPIEAFSRSSAKKEDSSIRAKYLDKINKLKQKKSAGPSEKTTRGVTGWVSKCGLQDFMVFCVG